MKQLANYVFLAVAGVALQYLATLGPRLSDLLAADIAQRGPGAPRPSRPDAVEILRQQLRESEEEELSYFAQSPVPRSAQMRETHSVRYRVGDVVRHRKHGYRGVRAHCSKASD